MELKYHKNCLGREKTGENYTSNDFVFFWKPLDKGGKVGPHVLTQWHNVEFKVGRVSFGCAEQYMMAEKALLFGDEEIYNQCLKKMHPKEYKALGRAIANFDETLWNEKKVDIVLEGNMAKFSQNKELKQYLLNTKSKIIVESSPYDKIWGIGLAKDHENAMNPALWQGENLLGFILMEVRDRLS